MLRQTRKFVQWEVWRTCVLDEVVCCFATKRCEEYRRTCTLQRWIRRSNVTILIAVFTLPFVCVNVAFSIFLQSSSILSLRVLVYVIACLTRPYWFRALEQSSQTPFCPLHSNPHQGTTNGILSPAHTKAPP